VSSSGPRSLDAMIDAIRSLSRFDGVTGKIDGTRFPAFADKDVLVTGRVVMRMRVKG
jgi:hypothetical protein